MEYHEEAIRKYRAEEAERARRDAPFTLNDYMGLLLLFSPAIAVWAYVAALTLK